MNQQPDPDWNQKLTQALRALPDREAPATLIPRVVAAIQAKERMPWWRRAWWTWPPSARLFSIILLAGLLGLLGYLGTQLAASSTVGEASKTLSSWLALLNPLWSILASLANACALVFQKAGQWVFLGAGLACLGMYLSCIGLGTLIYRVALRPLTVNPLKS